MKISCTVVQTPANRRVCLVREVILLPPLLPRASYLQPESQPSLISPCIIQTVGRFIFITKGSLSSAIAWPYVILRVPQDMWLKVHIERFATAV